MRQPIRTVINKEPDIHITSEASDGEELIKLAGELSQTRYIAISLRIR